MICGKSQNCSWLLLGGVFFSLWICVFILQRYMGWTNTSLILRKMKMVFHSMKATCLSNLPAFVVEPLPACQALFLKEDLTEGVYVAT